MILLHELKLACNKLHLVTQYYIQFQFSLLRKMVHWPPDIKILWPDNNFRN